MKCIIMFASIKHILVLLFFSSLIEPGHLTKEKIDGADYYKDSVLWGIKFWLNVEIHKMRTRISANRSFSAISYEKSETTTHPHF
ncbi:Uncharacterised protein [Legionella sainthelensi]|nr:Uncharacterised protein [Legionella sainthelensi]